MSEKMKGRVITKEWRAKISKSQIGKEILEETRKLFSKLFKGKHFSPNTEFKKGMTSPLKGRHNVKMSGENHPLWKGGITPVNQAIRQSLEYKLWRKEVFERDKYTCTWCGIRSGKGKAVTLHADHIRQFAYYPESRFEISNGRTLCINCHKKTDTYCKKIDGATYVLKEE